jgi:Ulp1 family protease
LTSEQNELAKIENKSPGEEKKSEHATINTVRQRAHFVTILVEDYEKLDPGELLNDSLVDLWMQW